MLTALSTKLDSTGRLATAVRTGLAGVLSVALASTALADAPKPPEDSPKPGPIATLVTLARAQLPVYGFERHSALVNGHELVWWQKGEGQPVVLLHGVADQAATWLLVTRLIGDGRQLFLLDLPGHGDSAPSAGPLPMGTVYGGVEGWLKAHAHAAKQPVTLVGNSMGAWLSALVAHRHPEWVEKAVLINGGPIAPRGQDAGVGLMPASRDEARALMAAIRDPSSPATPDAMLDDLVARVEGGQAQRMFAAPDDLEGYLLEGRLGEIKPRIEILWGVADRLLGAEFPKVLMAGLPDAELRQIPKCGHVPQVECPAALIPQLKAALDSER
ncbi:MAG: alpha/beta fold hydrolase [Acidobacteriota bacterium]